MGVEMFLGQSDQQAGTASSVLSNRISAYESIKASLQSFIGTANLQGHTYQSAKNYSSQVLVPLLKGCILLDEAIKETCAKLPREYRSQVDSIDLREDELREKILQAGMTASRYEYLASLERQKEKPNWSRAADLSLTASRYMEIERRLQEKLQKLLAFNSSSARLFDHIQPLLEAVNTGLKQTISAWNPSTKSFDVSGSALDWAINLNKQWYDKTTERAKALISKVESGKGLTSDELNELGGYLVDNPKSKLYDRGMKAFYEASKLDIEWDSFVKYLIKPDFISQGTSQIHPWFKTGYTMAKNFGSAVSKKYTKDSFLKYGTAGQKANNNLIKAWDKIKFYGKGKSAKWYQLLPKDLKKGNFNKLMGRIQRSGIDKLANLKLGKYTVSDISKTLGKITDLPKTSLKNFGNKIGVPKLLSKLKWVGKAVKVAGWATFIYDVGVTSFREYNNKDSRAYKSEGKALIHAGIAQLKSAGPIEGAVLLAKAGPWGALGGFIAGTVNTLWGVLHPESKDQAFSWLQNKLDDGYDAIANTEFGQRLYQTKEQIKEGIGQAVTSTWDTVTQGFNGGLANVP